MADGQLVLGHGAAAFASADSLTNCRSLLTHKSNLESESVENERLPSKAGFGHVSFVRPGYVLGVWIFLASWIFGTNCFASETVDQAKLLRAFDLGKGDAVLCYDRDLAFAFVPTGSTGSNTIKLVSLNGDQKVLFQVTEKIVEHSLSCSGDGTTIALVGENPSKGFDLFVLREGIASTYHLSNWSNVFPFEGVRSLLSESGHGIALPSQPVHMSGPDVLREMHLFVYPGEDSRVYFANENVVIERKELIEVLSFNGSRWARKLAKAKDPLLYIEQAGSCSDHIIGVFAIDESNSPSQLYDLTSGNLTKVRRFDRFQRLIKKEPKTNLVGSSDQNQCVYALERWDADLTSFVVFDQSGEELFAVPQNLTGTGEVTSLANRRIALSKDGCRVLVNTYVQPPLSGKGFNGPSQVLVLELRGRKQLCK